MLICNQHLYKSPAIEVYGHCRLLLPWLRVPCWFFCNQGLKNCWHGRPGIEPTTTTLDLSSQSGAYDLSAMATLSILSKMNSRMARHNKTHSKKIIAKYQEVIYIKNCFLNKSCNKGGGKTFSQLLNPPAHNQIVKIGQKT